MRARWLLLGMWNLDMEFSQNAGCPQNCHLKQNMMMNTESGFQVVRQAQKEGHFFTPIAHSSMANFISWREGTTGDLVLSCEQDEHKHNKHISISYWYVNICICLCRFVYICKQKCVRIYIYVCICLDLKYICKKNNGRMPVVSLLLVTLEDLLVVVILLRSLPLIHSLHFDFASPV